MNPRLARMTAAIKVDDGPRRTGISPGQEQTEAHLLPTRHGIDHPRLHPPAVAAIGPDVAAWLAGDEVFGLVNFPGRGAGYAEYAVAPADHLTRKPANLGHVEAAAVPMAGLTAYQFLFGHLGGKLGDTVLVNGAAGGHAQGKIILRVVD